MWSLLIFNTNGDGEMKLNVLTVLKNIDGEDLIEPDAKGEVSKVLLRKVLVNALMIPVEGETGQDKVNKYMLAVDIQKQDVVEVTPEQVVLLKAAVEKAEEARKKGYL